MIIPFGISSKHMPSFREVVHFASKLVVGASTVAITVLLYKLRALQTAKKQDADLHNMYYKSTYCLNNMTDLRQMVDKYPMMLFVGGDSVFVVVSNKTPGYNLGNRQYQILYQNPPEMMPEYMTEREFVNLVCLVTSASIDRCMVPDTVDRLHFTEKPGTIQWSLIVDFLQITKQVTCNEVPNPDAHVDSRCIRCINHGGRRYDLYPPMPVDSLSDRLTDFPERALFALAVGLVPVLDDQYEGRDAVDTSTTNDQQSSTMAVADNHSLPPTDFTNNTLSGSFVIQDT